MPDTSPKKHHLYKAEIIWTGAGARGTKNYRSFERSYDVKIAGKATIAGSSDANFRGDAACHNPEDMLLASLSSCHMLWYLHLCAVAGVVVTSYSDAAEGFMIEAADGSGRFTKVILNPCIKITSASDLEKAQALHGKANKMCFIANSVNFPVGHQLSISRT